MAEILSFPQPTAAKRKFDYKAFRAEFVRLKAEERKREDEERAMAGMNSYERAKYKADQRIATHYERMRELTYASAMRENGWMRFDNGRGEVDWYKVERQARRDWWQYPDYWHYGAAQRFTMVVIVGDEKVWINGVSERPVEFEAVMNIREAAEVEETASRFEREERDRKRREKMLNKTVIIPLLQEVYVERGLRKAG